VVNLNRYDDYNHFPYMDTLKFFNPDSSILDISHENDPGWYRLEDTGGDYIDQEDSGCDRCQGEEYVDCWDCDGSRYYTCDECDGDGKVDVDDGSTARCDVCDGDGRMDCDTCDGNGRVPCPECQ
jgi:hypothetical protein